MSAVAEQPVQAAISPPPYEAALVITGPAWQSRLLHDGQVLLSQPEVHLGALSNNDVVLGGPKVSRLHAAIRWTPAGYVIQDLDSQSGTFVEGQRLVQPALLVPGQRISIGDTDLVFQHAAGVAPSAFQTRIQHWARQQVGKQYWRIFLVGLAGYIFSAVVLNTSGNNHLVPLVALIGAAVVPVAFVVFCFEEGAFVDMPPSVVGLAFVSGGVFGLLGAAIFESPLGDNASAFATALAAGVVEESLKAAVLILFLRDKRLRSELDGLVLGVAVGMGFAAMETAGYGVDGFATGIGTTYTTGLVVLLKTIGTITQNGAEAAFVAGIRAGYETMEISLNSRMLFAVFGHGMWTGMVGAAIWRYRGTRTFTLTGGVVGVFALAVALHFFFDFFIFANIWPLDLVLIPVITAFFAFFLHEAITRAKLGPLAPPPPPLGAAMMQFFSRPFNRARAVQLHPAVAGALAAATPVSAAPPASAVSPVPAATPIPVAPPMPAEIAPQPAIFCPNCGTQSTPGHNFCAHCGHQLPQR